MDSPDRPKLPSAIYKAIESSQIKVDEYFWKRLLKFQVSAAAANVVRLGYPDLAPMPPVPKKPDALRTVIASYTRNLFAAEALRYSRDERLGFYLTKLGERIVGRVMDTLAALENAGQFKHASLDYHGLTPDQLRTVATEEIHSSIEGLLRQLGKPAPLPLGGAPEPGTWNSSTATGLQAKKGTERLAATRKAVVKPILESKGWSELDWANESNVAYHTAADYLAGKTSPYASTRVKLAKSIGLSIQQLPH
jgi:hypothetical protein